MGTKNKFTRLYERVYKQIMRYYILYQGDTEADTVKDINQLGDDNGFGVFWANR